MLTAIVAKAQSEEEAQEIYCEILERNGVIENLVWATYEGVMVTVVYDKEEILNKEDTEVINKALRGEIISHAEHTELSAQGLEFLIQETKTVKSLQREAKAFNKTEVLYDVYSDRVNFIGCDNHWLVDFFRRRNVLADSDRGGFSIDINDAVELGFPVAANSYRLLSDARRAPIVC